MFERSFAKNQKRPTAKEWFEHLKYLDGIKKKCKKNPNHIYFTNKGCGLCAVEEKFKAKIASVKEEKAAPQKIRGIEVKALTTENTAALKKQKRREFVRLNKLALFFICLYFVFWGGLPVYLYQFSDILTAHGYFIQILALMLILKAVFFGLGKVQKYLPLMQNQVLMTMLKIYALMTAVVGFLIINKIDFSFLSAY